MYGSRTQDVWAGDINLRVINTKTLLKWDCPGECREYKTMLKYQRRMLVLRSDCQDRKLLGTL